MPVEVSKLALVSQNPAPFDAPFVWDLTIEVTGDPPKGDIDLSIMVGCDPESSGGDVVLEELEIEGNCLKTGKNSLRIEHSSIPFATHGKYFESNESTCPLMFELKYGTQGAFQTIGIPVIVQLKEGIELETLERIDSPSLLTRNVLIKAPKSVVRRLITIPWDEEVATQEVASSGPVAALEADIVPAVALEEEVVFQEDEDLVELDEDDDDKSPDTKKLRSE
eukprot:GILI01043975.1.p1 GENE.GILI01043975.1~~GILI01043975.1.p1  ORF type:complete len:223 (-),score=49.08 GILI01043975.1:33-701(-)